MDEILPHIRGIINAHEIWQKLKSLYETTDELRVLLLSNELVALKMIKSDSVPSHITKMQELKDQLQAIGYNVEEKNLVTRLLSSLPKSYSNFVTSLSVSSRDINGHVC